MADQQSGDKQVLELQCPSCKDKVLWTEDFPYRPFCSKRCQLTDFGEWANESHRIPGGSGIEDDKLSDEPFQDY